MNKRPNVLLVVADDMGFSDPGCYGGEVSTPTMDRLARGGLRFTQHYSTARCWPSRACILTGHYYQQVPQVPDGGDLPAWGRPAPHYLKPLGYRCYHSGKWHVNQFPEPTTHGGFERSYYVRDYDRNFAVQDHRLDGKPLPPVEPGSGYYSSTAIAGHAVDFLRQHNRRHKEDPFFLYLAFIAPHFPLHAPEEDIACYKGAYDRGWDQVREERLERMRQEGILDCELSGRQPRVKPRWNLSEAALKRRIGAGEAGRAVAWKSLTPKQREFQATKMQVHAAMVHRMDREIGRVVDQLEKMGQLENTLILFVSDNGASAEQIIRGDGHAKGSVPGTGESYLCLGPGWSTAANTPFRYHKSWVHEGGIASPLIVHWPDGIKDRGTLRHTPGHFVDVLPTILDAAGAGGDPAWKDSSRPPLAGASLRPAFDEDREVPHDFLYFSHIGHRALRQGKWKIVSVHHGQWELYDLEKDRAETNNLAARHPARVRRMAALWQKQTDLYRSQCGEDRVN